MTDKPNNSSEYCIIKGQKKEVGKMIIRKSIFIAVSTLVMTQYTNAQSEKAANVQLSKIQHGSNQWTSQVDCQDEQDAIRNFRHASSAIRCFDEKGNDTEQSIALAIARPWEERYSNNKQGTLVTTGELNQIALHYTRLADELNTSKFHTYPFSLSNQCTIALYRLRACAYKTAAARKEGIARETAKPTP